MLVQNSVNKGCCCCSYNLTKNHAKLSEVLTSCLISLFQPAEVPNTELSKQREIEKEKENLMDEGDFLEYKVSGKHRYFH